MYNLKFFEKRIINHPFRCLLSIFILIFLLSFIIIAIIELKLQIKSSSRIVLQTINQESEKFQLVTKDIENIINLTFDIKEYSKKFNEKLVFASKSLENKI